MRNLKSSAFAVAAAVALTLIPASLQANEEERHFYSYMNPGTLHTLAGFDNANFELVGAYVVIKGTIGGDPAVKVIKYSGTGDHDLLDMPRGGLRDSVLDLATQSTEEKPGRARMFALPLGTPNACKAIEPVLAVGNEFNYHIIWCNNSTPSAPPDNSAKKNYYYMYASGDFQLVLTMEYDCNLPADTAAMPTEVYEGACQ